MNDIIYADFESLLSKYDTCLDNNLKSHTTNISQHASSGYAINIVRHHDNSSKITHYRGTDCISKFCKEIRDVGNNLFNTPKKPILPLSNDQLELYYNTHKCFICQQGFIYDKYNKN